VFRNIILFSTLSPLIAMGVRIIVHALFNWGHAIRIKLRIDNRKSEILSELRQDTQKRKEALRQQLQKIRDLKKDIN